MKRSDENDKKERMNSERVSDLMMYMRDMMYVWYEVAFLLSN